MAVYGELLILENFIIGGGLIYMTARVHRIGFLGVKRIIRLIAGAIMCGLFALTIFMDSNWILNFIGEVLFSLLVTLVVFGKKNLILRAATFIVITYLIGGIVMALLLATGTTAIRGSIGIYTGSMRAGQLVMFMSISMGACSQIIRTIQKRRFQREHIFWVKIKIGEFISREKAYFDSGNTLQDPLFGVAVAVADHSLWTDISRGGALKMERFCLVPYESVGGRGVLQGVRCDYIEVSGKITKGCIIARGEKDAFFGLGDDECRLLLSRDMEPGGE